MAATAAAWDEANLLRINLAVILVTLVFSVYPQANVRAQSLQLASLLYPESANWRVVGNMPSLKTGDINTFLAGDLWDAIADEDVRAIAGDDLHSAAGCAITLFYYPGAMAHFHRITLKTHPGGGVFYSGPTPCEEGDTTIIWPDISDDATMPSAVVFPGTLIRIENSLDPRFVGFVAGCCGDDMGRYVSAPILSYNAINAWYVENDLVIPKDIEAVHQTRTFSQELIVRVAPTVEDTFDAGRSHFLGRASLGNIERRYLPGAHGTLIGEWTDRAGHKWYLIAISDLNNAYLSVYSSTNAEVGWIAD